jgi:inner membrane protein
METNTLIQSVWQGSKLLVKALLIGGMALVLLIPSLLIQDVIKEREQRQKEAVKEVSSKWAGQQTLTGPILVLPYRETVVGLDMQTSIVRQEAYFLPDKLNVESKLTPQKRNRGIYEVILYSSDIKFTGSFASLPLSALKIDPSNILWNEAYVCMGISDAKGLSSELQLNYNDSAINLAPSTVQNASIDNAFVAPISLTQESIAKGLTFTANFTLNGSEQLLFTPVGKETTVEVRSDWPDPSSVGNQLPVSNTVSKDGFTAKWKSLSHTRKFPQVWRNNAYTETTLAKEAFGTSLFVPVNGYQKTMRSVKYAILCILLTFAAFFIIDTANNKSIHPFQYGLIGMALILFYTLLLSFSEYTGFNTAYIIATVATVGLISWFVKSLLKSFRLTAILSVILVILYSYIFTILQLQDYSLIMGSIGLFLTLAVIMHFSKKIKW